MINYFKKNKYYILFVISLIIQFKICLYGVDVTDHSYWFSESYLILQGNMPLVDLWNPTIISHLVVFPFVALFTLFTNGTEGIMSFMFQVAVLIRFLLCISLFNLLKKNFSELNSFLFSSILFFVAIGRRGINYDSLSFYLLVYISILLFTAYRETALNKQKLYYSLSGILMAICVLSHISTLIVCFYFFLLINLLNKNNKQKLMIVNRYTIFGTMFAILVLFSLFFLSDFHLLDNLEIVLKQSYFNIERKSFFFNVLVILLFFSFSLITVYALNIINKIVYLKNKLDIFSLVSLANIVWVTIMFKLLTYKNYPFLTDYFLFYLFFITCLLLFHRIKVEKNRFIILFIIFPSILHCLALLYLSYSSIIYRTYLFASSGLLLFLIIEDNFNFIILKRFFNTKVLLWCCLMITAFITQYYNIYRDDYIGDLNYIIDNGIYKNMITSKEKGETLESIESILKSEIDNDDSLMILDQFPGGYLMSEAEPFTMSSWFRCESNCNELLTYIDYKNTLPTKILTITSENTTILLNNKDTRILNLINEEYKLQYSYDSDYNNDLFSFKLYSLKK